MESFHPETVEMEDFYWDISSFHSFEERVNRLFVVVCGETGTEPETKTPARNLSRLSSQDGVFLKDFLRRWAMNYVPIKVRRDPGNRSWSICTISISDPQYLFELCNISHFQFQGPLCQAYQ